MEVIIIKNEVIGVALAESRRKANDKYNQKAYESIAFRSRKEKRLGELLAFASEKEGVSKTVYVEKAIWEKLTRDGITTDMLPADSKYTPPQPEPKQPKRYMIYMITENWLQRNSMVESFVTSFATLNMARKYVQDKFNKKAYPEDWLYAIRGRYIEADNKANALLKMREIIKEALDKHDEASRFGDGKQSTAFYIDYISRLNPTAYCEHITYDGNDLEYTEIKEDLDSLKENYPYEDTDFEEIDLEDIVGGEES